MTVSRTPFRALVHAHLRMTLRGRASQAFAGQMAGRPLGILWLLTMYVAIGASTVPVARAGADAFTYAFVTQLVTWTLCGVSLTAETGDALFHPAERDVLGHRPVGVATTLAAKVLVLFLFVLGLAVAVNVVPTMMIGRSASLRLALAHLAAVATAVAVLTAMVVALYGLAARFVPRDRFDDVAARSQVVLAIAFVGLAIAMPRLLWNAGGVHLDPTRWFIMLLPPAWFAALGVWLGGSVAPGVTPLAIVAMTLAVALVLAIRGATVARLAGALARIDEERGGRAVRPLPAVDGLLLGRWLRSPVEAAAFRLATAYLRRDRDVRLRLDPSLVTFTLMPLSGLVLNDASGGHLVPLAAVCLLGMLPGVALEALRISSHPAASELFAIAPIAGTAEVFHGVRKAAIAHVLPALALSLTLAVAFAPSGVPLAIPGLIALPTFTLLPALFGPYVPLARAKARGQQAAANAVLLTVSTAVLAVLVAETLRASRSDSLVRFCVIEVIVVAIIDRLLRVAIARRGLTSTGASPSYGAR